MASFTQGPWRAIVFGTQRQRRIMAGDRHIVGVAWGNKEDETADANARLMAAAPHLLYSLECLVQHLECSAANCPIVNDAKVAIAKAKGEQ